MEELITAANTVGIPFVAFVLMYRLYREERRRAREERSEWMDSIGEHTEAVRSLRRSLDQRALADGGQDAGDS